jgi:hypothetical protein
MALKVICDGCATPLETPDVIVRGIVVARQYCAGCADVADKFAEDRDKVHTAVAKKWNEDMAKKISAFVKANPDFALPDV